MHCAFRYSAGATIPLSAPNREDRRHLILRLSGCMCAAHASRVARLERVGENRREKAISQVEGSRLNEQTRLAEAVRERVLSPVDRVSELLFGLFMALTFVGAVSVAQSGRAEIRATLAAALGCNLA